MSLSCVGLLQLKFKITLHTQKRAQPLKFALFAKNR